MLDQSTALQTGSLPAENIHVHIPRGISAENLVPQVLVRLFKPREMEIDQRAIIFVCPQHPLPVRMMHSPSIAPPNKPIRKLLRLPTLMNNLWYRSIDRTQRSLHQLSRRQIFGLWKTYLIRGTLNLRFDSRTRYIQSRQVEQVLPQPRDIAGGKIMWSDIEGKVDKEIRDQENGDGDKGSQTALHVDT
jgi:hypothetical protein